MPGNGRSRNPPSEGQPVIVLNNRYTQYPVIARVCRRIGWAVTTGEPVQSGWEQLSSGNGSSSPMCGSKESSLEWFVLWSDSGQSADRLVRNAKCYQRTNHFPGMVQIYRKSHLARSMMRMQKMCPSYFDFFPKTWILPFEASDVCKYLDGGGKDRDKDRCIIVKPSGGAQGKGIYLAMSSKAIKPDEDAVAQVYINRPLLIDGLKFDLRIYVLVTCVDPLRILIYKEGLVRFCTTPYKCPDASNLGCTFMHLTNYSINKHNASFVQPSGGESSESSSSPRGPGEEDCGAENYEAEGSPGSSTPDEKSSKRSLGWLWEWMLNHNMNAESVWRDISDVVVKTLISIQATLAQSYRSCKVDATAHTPFTCFEVLGFDIMITESLKPILVEVNHMPSFRTDSPLDSRIKIGLIENTLRLLNVSPDDRKRFQLRSALLSQIRLYGSTFASKGKNKTKLPKLESKAELWAKYERNEARNLGNFELIYPTNCYAHQPTSGKQPLYQKLLAKAHQSLGSPITDPEDAHLVLGEYLSKYAESPSASVSKDDDITPSPPQLESPRQSREFTVRQPPPPLPPPTSPAKAKPLPPAKEAPSSIGAPQEVKVVNGLELLQVISATVQEEIGLKLDKKTPFVDRKKKKGGNKSRKERSKKDGAAVIEADNAEGEKEEVVNVEIDSPPQPPQHIDCAEHEESSRRFFDEDCPPVPSILGDASKNIPDAFISDADLKMEEIRRKYLRLREQWMEKFQKKARKAHE